MKLFKPYNSKNNNTALNYVNKITNEITLQHIFRNARNSLASIAALKKIKDQQFIYEFIMTSKFITLQDIAAHNLTDGNLSYQLCQTNQYPSVSLIVIKNIADNEKLQSLYKNSTSIGFKLAVIEQITDQQLLANIAINEPSPNKILVINAARKVIEPAHIVSIADNQINCQEIQLQALQMSITNSDILKYSKRLVTDNYFKDIKDKLEDSPFDNWEELFNTSTIIGVQQLALENITNEDFLVNVAKTNSNYNIRMSAFKQINSEEAMLNCIMLKNGSLIEEAINRINSDIILYQMIDLTFKDGCDGDAAKIFQKLTNKNLIFDFINSEAHLEDKIFAYQFTENCNKAIFYQLSYLFRITRIEPSSTAHLQIVAASQKLHDLLAANPIISKLFYSDIIKTVNLPHSDLSVSTDGCVHSDHHGDGGRGVSGFVIPTYPFDD